MLKLDRRLARATAFASLISLGVAALSGCGQQAASDTAQARTLSAITEAGTLRVAVRNAPTVWYVDRFGRNAGPEYALAADFADSLGLTVELVERETVKGVLNAVRRGQADLAAAGLTGTAGRAEVFGFSPAIQSITENVVCHRDGPKPDQPAGLVGIKLEVAEDSSYVDTLEALKESQPDLKFSTRDASTEQLLRAVSNRKLDCTVADSHIAALNRRYFPELVSTQELTQPQPLVWMYAKSADALGAALDGWFERPQTAKTISAVLQAAYAPAEVFDYVDVRAYVQRIDRRLPRYDDWFDAAGQAYEIDPVLLAAQAYQESHWDPDAKSPTGVRGLMMLTRTTAESLGVTDRTDPQQSIDGGAKYLAKMKARFADDIPEPDLTYLALAAYNIGRAHMHDAQTLARQRGLNPQRWADIKQVLPLLADKSVYPQLKYGYARGHEPVRYVERIRDYEDILARTVE